MDPKMKETLLKRKFSSLEYMQEMVEAHGRAVKALEDALGDFFNKYPSDVLWPKGCMPDVWEERVLTNFRRMQKSMEAGLQETKQGDTWRMASAVGSLRGLSKDMDGIAWEFWDHVDHSLFESFGRNLGDAEQHGENLYWTLDDDWRPGSILKEKITGPIDEQELLKYLNPGETV